MRTVPTLSVVVMAALIQLMPSPARADDAEIAALIAALRAEIGALNDRLASLEDRQRVAEHTYGEAKASQSATSASSWTDTIKLKGDLRYRHEGFNVEDERERHRQRIRARTQLTAAVNDTVSVGFGLASGSDDPISTNQSLGDGSSSKSVVIDLAYASWKTPVEGLTMTAGKFKNPFHRVGGNGMVFDGDLNPEGLGLSYRSGPLFVNGAAIWMDESSSDDDSYLFGVQSGFNAQLGEGVLTTGVSYYNFLDSRGETPFFDGTAQGNRLDVNGQYLSGFELVEGFAEYAFAIGDTKLSMFADYVHNLDADDLDTGWTVGADVKRNKWQLGWSYRDLEADAVLGTFTDSDFAGGGTDGEGHILQAGYALTSNLSINGTLLLNDRNVDIGADQDYKRLMLDLSFKY